MLILICGLVAYCNAPYGAFQYDDHKFLAMPCVQGGLSGMYDLFCNSFHYGGISVRPMALATMNLNYWLFGDNTTGWIVFSLMIHLACAGLIYAVVRQMVGGQESRKRRVALFTALFFVCSPITPYAVTYITQSRMEALAGLCIMATLFFYIKGYRVLALISCVVGCLCKETAYLAPGLLFVYALCFERLGVRKIGLLMFGGVLLLFVGMYVNHPLRCAVVGDGWSLSGGLLGRVELPMTLDILGEYTKRILLPMPGWLSIDPDYSPYQNSILLLSPIGLFVVLCVRKLNKDFRVALFSVLCFLALMIVPLVIIPIKPDDKVVIYKAYLACFPAYLCISVFLDRVLRQRAVFAVLPILIVFCYWTHGVNSTFASEQALWRDAAQEAPERLRPHYNVATAILVHEDDLPEVERWYTKTLELADEKTDLTRIEKEVVVKTYYNLGLIKLRQGQIWDAAGYFIKVRELPRAQKQLKKIERYLAEHDTR